MHEPSFAELSALAAEHIGCTFEDDPSATIELAVVGLTVRAWRNTSLEDLHAADRGGGDFSDSSMMRFNIATTRVVSKFVSGRGVDWRGLHSALTNPGRALPGGRTVGELTGDSFDRLAGDVESVVIRTSFTESQRGVAYALTHLALQAGLSYKGWYGTPWWGDAVDVFMERLSDRATYSGVEVRPTLDPGLLRQALLGRPESLGDADIYWCLDHDLGRGVPFAGYARWRRRREPEWIDPSPGLSEG